MSKRKHRKDLFSFGLRKNHPKKYQVGKLLFYEKQVFINWFL